MPRKNQIDLRELQRAVNAILDHIVDDLGIETLPIRKDKDLYWDVPMNRLYDVKKDPPKLDVGRLADDLEFVMLMLQDERHPVGAVLLHVAPLLRHVGEEIGQ